MLPETTCDCTLRMRAVGARWSAAADCDGCNDEQGVDDDNWRCKATADATVSAVDDNCRARVRVSGDVLMRLADGIRNRRVDKKYMFC